MAETKEAAHKRYSLLEVKNIKINSRWCKTKNSNISTIKMYIKLNSYPSVKMSGKGV